VLRFNARGPDGLKDGKAPGQPSRLKGEHRHALIQMVEEGPNRAEFFRWRIAKHAFSRVAWSQ